jgi:hypothetical protein
MDIKQLAQKMLGMLRPVWKKDMTKLLKSQAVQEMIRRQVRKEVKYALSLINAQPVAESIRPVKTMPAASINEIANQFVQEEPETTNAPVSLNVGGVNIPMDMTDFGQETAVDDLSQKIDVNNPAVVELHNKLYGSDYSRIMAGTAKTEKASRATAMMQKGII